ncbi:hypothetical protein PIB30_076919 [Stylosanthes scabra]|uniref:Ubiquitin-like protease family profile domain-containing protein n=1 Tax=Stylosanthes scabra TaxID=79078 RepID=A0ABU6VNW2_9FABA|nr:hypothetical protein [Stylosanthes scabra]
MGKREILRSRLARSVQMEDATKEKETLGKRKHVQEDEPEDVSSDSDSEQTCSDSDSESESEPNSERIVFEEEKIIADAASGPLHHPLENPVAAAPIETLPPTAAPLPENAAVAVDPPSQGVVAIDDVLVTPPDSGIEVVEATSAEEELIRRELSESITNLVVRTNVEKGDIAEKESVIEELTHKYLESNSDPKDNVKTDKEVEEEINRNIMMIAKMVVAHSEIGPLPSFDLGIDFGSQSQSQSQPKKEKEPEQETEKLDQDVQKLKSIEIQQHQGPEIKTPEEAIQKREDMKSLCYKWATKPEGNNKYQHLFRFKTGKEYEAMRYHFTSMAEEAEMDLAHNILEKYGPDYIDTKTGLPYKIETMLNLDALDYIDENKIKSAPFSNVLDQMRVHAGAETMFPRMTRNVVTHKLVSQKQPNAFDCGVYVMKYLDIVNPSLLGKKNFTVPVWTEDELQRFREEFVERILYDGDNYYRHQAIKASNPIVRQPRPSTALQSPYTQLK